MQKMIGEFFQYLAYSVCISLYLFISFKIPIDFFLHSLQRFIIYVIALLTFPFSFLLLVAIDVLRKFFYSLKEV